MRIGIVLENKSNFPFEAGDRTDLDSELFSDAEEDALLSGLRDAGHEVMRIGDGKQLLKRLGYWRRRCDIVFNLSVGYRGLGRKSYVPGVLELAGIPYIGSDAYALSLTRHKYHAKLVVRAAGVTTAPSVLWMNDECTQQLASISYPVIVKPVAESSSIGIDRNASVVPTPEAAASRARWVVATFDQPALVETFVHGTEVEVPMLGWPTLRALGVAAVTIDGEPVRGDMFLSSDFVYSDSYGFVTDVPWINSAAVIIVALQAAAALGIRDYGRIDLRIAPDGMPHFIEASTHPHIQPHSSFYAFACDRGQPYHQMLDDLVTVSMARHGIQSSQKPMSQKYQGSR